MAGAIARTGRNPQLFDRLGGLARAARPESAVGAAPSKSGAADTARTGSRPARLSATRDGTAAAAGGWLCAVCALVPDEPQYGLRLGLPGSG